MYKRKNLSTVPGMETRPTADRLRETLFNILAGDVRGAVVLDLFAGTGALGLESMSRGARCCVFIENRKEALAVIRKNCAACPDFIQRSKVICWDVSQNLNCIKSQTPGFDLVFADPPYGKNLLSPALSALAKSESLAQGARIVLEHGSEDPVPQVQGFHLFDQRTYGRTTVTFLTFEKDDGGQDLSGP